MTCSLQDQGNCSHEDDLLQVYETFQEVFLPKLLAAIQREVKLSKQAGKIPTCHLLAVLLHPFLAMHISAVQHGWCARQGCTPSCQGGSVTAAVVPMHD